MGNHYHLVVQTRQANLSLLMRHINGHYSQSYNRRHGLVGHVFQGRFKAIVVDTDAYLLEVCRYVDLNPVRAAMVAMPGDWSWSSYGAHTARAPAAPWLDSALLYQQLAPLATRPYAAARYATFVAEGHGVRLWDDALHGQIYLGDEAFATRMQARVNAPDSPEVPQIQRRPVRRVLTSFFGAIDRDQAILAAYRQGRYSQTEIARHLQLSISRVSRIIGVMEGNGKAKGKT